VTVLRGRRTRAAEKTMMTAAPAPAEHIQTEHIQKSQLERSVSWTGRERLRCLWYRLRLTVQEMNYAARRIVELQMRLTTATGLMNHRHEPHRDCRQPST
jgi:hypothetical protein